MILRRIHVQLVTFAAIVAIVLANMAPSSADYAAPNFAIINSGTHAMMVVNVSPHGNNDWGPNLIQGTEILPNQYDYVLRGWTLPSCDQDVRVIFDNGEVSTTMGYNVCGGSLTWHY